MENTPYFENKICEFLKLIRKNLMIVDKEITEISRTNFLLILNVAILCLATDFMHEIFCVIRLPIHNHNQIVESFILRTKGGI